VLHRHALRRLNETCGGEQGEKASFPILTVLFNPIAVGMANPFCLITPRPINLPSTT
jgi:hypothetical protein